MNKSKVVLAAAGAAAVALVLILGTAWDSMNNWFDNDLGPGSGEEREYDPALDGPGSGEFAEHDPMFDGPGSGEFAEHDPMFDGPGSGEFATPEPAGPGSGEELNEKHFATVALGSCDVIAEGSTCIEYIGKYWKTPSVAELNCDGVGIYSNKPCPRPTSGGCHGSAGTDFEMIIWYYPYGGDPISGELITYAAGTCNANPMTNYIFTD